jgi:hypothetical protein
MNGVPRVTRASATGEAGWPLRSASRIARSKSAFFVASNASSMRDFGSDVLEQHADHRLVFDDEDPIGLRRGAFGCHP